MSGSECYWNRFPIAARNLDGENLNFKGYEKKKWTHPRFLHRGPKKAVEQDSDVHFDLTWAKKKKKKRVLVQKTAIFL